MIELRHSIAIDVPPSRIWEWLAELPLHYREWHPAHIACRYERGDSLVPGSVLYVEETLHGRLHRLRLRTTEVFPNRVVRYRGNGFSGVFRLEPTDEGSRFTAELAFGPRIPVIGSALDALARALLGPRLVALETHLREEGENLKRLLEHPKPPG